MSSSDTSNASFPAELFINRELSQLEFMKRVLEQAKDETVPLLERLRFLCISSSVLDEFYEIRVAGLVQQQAFGSSQRGPDNLSPSEQLKAIAERARTLVNEQYRVLNKELIPRLDAQGIRFLRRAEWNKQQAKWMKDYFRREVAPIATPVGLDPAHPFPKILNKSLTFIITLEGKDAFGRNSGKAVLQAPRALPRVIQLPERVSQSAHDFVFLSSIIHAHVGELFPGMKVTGCYQFRVTRNSDLFVDEEEVDDLLRALEGELPGRRYGDEVRLELADDCPDELEVFLTAQFGLTDIDAYRCNGPVNLMRLAAVPDLVDRPDLKYPGFTPGLPAEIASSENLFEVIRRRDVLLHHPFESFAPVIDFLRQAASDPNVLSIRQTLYRTGAESAVVQALISAAVKGKDVLVVVELRARFDEEANIELANALQQAGAQVVYGIVGKKTHSKLSMVIRREGSELRRYVHMSTGNYHARTARLYTDYGLFTANREIAEDVQKQFAQLTAMGKASDLQHLLQSPFTLHDAMMRLVQAEAENARQGKPARVMAKMNSLIEPKIIEELYRASQAGVQIDLIIRGVCSVRPGIEGVSENIRVRSIIGRFLEHTRVFYFDNDGDPKVYLSSADWMGRNFFNRVETCFPVLDPQIRQRVIAESFDAYLADTAQAWVLQTDGTYCLPDTDPADRVSAQQTLLDALAG